MNSIHKLITKFLVTLMAMGASALVANETDSFSWDHMEKLRQSIVVPEFPDRDFLVQDFGAIPDGKTDSTEAFRKAIAA